MCMIVLWICATRGILLIHVVILHSIDIFYMVHVLKMMGP
jgi:hypothetical protein